MKERKIKPLVQSIRTGLTAAPASRMRRRLFAAGLAALSLAAQAADTDTPAAVAVDAGKDGGIEVVTVTARKATELVQDVPISISTVRADQMIKENINGIRDYFSRIPGLNVGRTGGRTDISIRGITTGTNTNPTMAVTIDDSPFGSSTSSGGGSMMLPDIDPFDLQRIEVLRGPQGTLYGASNLGGLIKYVTLLPNTSVLSGRVQVDGSQVAHGGDGYGVRGAINVPIIKDELGLRVSVFSREDPGWIDNHTTGEKDVNKTTVKGGRASVLWTPNENFTLRASALHQQASGKGVSGEAVDANLKPIYGDYTSAVMPGSFIYDRSIDFYDLALTADLHWATLSSTSSYGRMRFQGPQDISWVFGGLLERIFGAPAGARITAPMSVNKRTQEFRLDSPEGASKLDWRLGVFSTDEDTGGGQQLTARDRTTAALLGFPVLIDSTSTGSFKEYAAFGVLTYHFTNQFDVQGGLRYSHNKQEYGTHQSGILAGDDPDFLGASSESKTTYMITPRYKVSKDLMLYSTLSTGYRPGGPNTSLAAGIPTSYGADTTRNLEIGAKGQYFDHKLALDVALFKIDWKNIQVLLREPVSSFSYYANVGGAKSEGLELSAMFYPAAGWTISGNTALTRSVLTASTGSTSNGNPGDRLPYVARVTGALSVNRDIKLGNGWTAFGGASSAYVGDRFMEFGDSAADVRYHLPGYTTFGLTLGARNQDWSVNAFVKNLSDKRGMLTASDAGQLAPSNVYKTPQGSISTITPRTIGMSVSRSF